MQTIDAVYENGAFRPDQPLNLQEGQRVRLTVQDVRTPDALTLAANVYEGLPAAEVDEIERIALDRSRFFAQGGSP